MNKKLQAIKLADTELDEETFLHSLRIAHQTDNDFEFIVAMLHDVVEESDVITVEHIENKFGISIAILVEALTRKENETYMEYIKKLSKTMGKAKKIKILDLKDHLAIERIGNLNDSMIQRYIKAFKILKEG
jgi:(p)ppGpp synthase/HD superfamily hydrolase